MEIYYNRNKTLAKISQEKSLFLVNLEAREVYASKSDLGLLIGKGGSNIRLIQEKFGCRLTAKEYPATMTKITVYQSCKELMDWLEQENWLEFGKTNGYAVFVKLEIIDFLEQANFFINTGRRVVDPLFLDYEEKQFRREDFGQIIIADKQFVYITNIEDKLQKRVIQLEELQERFRLLDIEYQKEQAEKQAWHQQIRDERFAKASAELSEALALFHTLEYSIEKLFGDYVTFTVTGSSFNKNIIFTSKIITCKDFPSAEGLSVSSTFTEAKPFAEICVKDFSRVKKDHYSSEDSKRFERCTVEVSCQIETLNVERDDNYSYSERFDIVRSEIFNIGTFDFDLRILPFYDCGLIERNEYYDWNEID